MLYLVLVALYSVVCACIAGAIATSNGRSGLSYGFLGFIFGLIGVLIAALVGKGDPKAPDGWVAVRCPRCNTTQNIPDDGAPVACFHCQFEMAGKAS